MKTRPRSPILIALCVLAVVLSACQSYQQRVVPAKMPSTYPNATEVAGATVAARVYEDKKEAEALFGFDILGAGVIPVQVIFDNRGTHPLLIVPGQTLLVDEESSIWPILDAKLAYERISKKTQFGEIAPQATKGGVLAGIAGAVIGAAIGIVTGTSVGNAAGMGAAAGAAAGSVAGGTKGYLGKDTQRKIREDIQKRTLENRAVLPNEIAYGFILFPGEAAKGKELRIGIKETDTPTIHALIMKF
jgi:hypothetical protein